MFFIIMLVASIGTLIKNAAMGSTHLLAGDILIILVVIYGICFSLVGMGGFIFTMADISLTNTGVFLSLLGSWSFFIPWERLSKAEIIEVRHINFSRLDRIRWRSFAITIPGSIILTSLGLVYGLGFKSVFIVTPQHDRYEKLIEKIKHHASGN
jgi:hypothetical protein